MNILLVLIYLLQVVGTPVADGSFLVISSETIQFPDLPPGTTPTPINQDWELLYYEVHASSSQYVIRGEIRNISPNPLTTPTLIVTVAGGIQIGIHPDTDQTKPGERAPFQHSVYQDEVMAALNQSQTVEFSGVCEDFYSVVPTQAFTWAFEDIEIEYDAGRSAVQISGSVTNVGETSAEGYAPMLFAFTSDGHYVGSIYPIEIPSTIFSGDQVAFEMDHGFDSYHSNEPFAGAGKDAVFVLAMAQPTYVSINCVT